MPLAHPPGDAQVDFGEAIGVIGGVRQKIHFLCMDLPQSDACFVKAYPRETTEAFLDGHVAAFAFFGGVPQSILYDNTTIAVAKILGDGKRERTRAFTELCSHYLFRDRFARPAKGNDKGKVEGLVKFARANFMVPDPARCQLRRSERHAGGALPRSTRRSCQPSCSRRSASDWWPTASPCCGRCRRCRWSRARSAAARVSSMALVRYRTNDYSVPTAYGFQDVVVKGFVDEVVILCGGKSRSPATSAAMARACSSPIPSTIWH